MARGIVTLALMLAGCPDPARELHIESMRLRYLEAIGRLVSIACPCALSKLDLDEGRLDELACHPCDGMLVPVTTTPPMGRLQ